MKVDAPISVSAATEELPSVRTQPVVAKEVGMPPSREKASLKQVDLLDSGPLIAYQRVQARGILYPDARREIVLSYPRVTNEDCIVAQAYQEILSGGTAFEMVVRQAEDLFSEAEEAYQGSENGRVARLRRIWNRAENGLERPLRAVKNDLRGEKNALGRVLGITEHRQQILEDYLGAIQAMYDDARGRKWEDYDTGEKHDPMEMGRQLIERARVTTAAVRSMFDGPKAEIERLGEE